MAGDHSMPPPLPQKNAAIILGQLHAASSRAHDTALMDMQIVVVNRVGNLNCLVQNTRT